MTCEAVISCTYKLPRKTPISPHNGIDFVYVRQSSQFIRHTEPHFERLLKHPIQFCILLHETTPTRTSHPNRGFKSLVSKRLPTKTLSIIFISKSFCVPNSNLRLYHIFTLILPNFQVLALYWLTHTHWRKFLQQHNATNSSPQQRLFVTRLNYYLVGDVTNDLNGSKLGFLQTCRLHPWQCKTSS